MNRRIITRYAVFAWLSVSIGGCSFVFVNGPPTGHEQMGSFSCTESRVFPILDVVGVGSSLVGAATAEDDKPYLEGGPLFGLSREENIIANLATAAILGTSAVVGFRRVSSCRAARLEMAGRSGEVAASVVHHVVVLDPAWPTHGYLLLKP